MDRYEHMLIETALGAFSQSLTKSASRAKFVTKTKTVFPLPGGRKRVSTTKTVTKGPKNTGTV